MVGVVFVFVREDASEAETLAEAFDAEGYSITGDEHAELCVVLWSRRALRSHVFQQAAERALRSGKAIVAGIFAPPPRDAVFDAPVIDLTAWDGVDSAALTPLFEAADDIVHPVEADVIVLPPPQAVYEDAEFVEAPLMIPSAESVRTKAARRSWEAPIPNHMLRPVPHSAPADPKLGAPAPRRDFRRIGGRKQQARAHAALVFAVIAILGGGAFVASVAANTVSHQHAERPKTELSGGGVSLTSATSEAIGLEDIAPEAPAQIGHRGLEPPSARTVHRASYEPQEEGR